MGWWSGSRSPPSFKTTVVPRGFIAPISISTTVVLTFLVNQGRQLGDTRTSVKCSWGQILSFEWHFDVIFTNGLLSHVILSSHP